MEALGPITCVASPAASPPSQHPSPKPSNPPNPTPSTPPRTPHPLAGALLGLRPGYLAPGRLYRSAVEGSVLSLLSAYRTMLSLGMPPASELRVVGGGSVSPLWRRIIADSFQIRLRFPAEAEAAALGAALQAAAVVEGRGAEGSVAGYVADHEPPLEEGAMEPDPSAAAAYEAAYAAFKAAGGALFGAGGALAS